jgi:hypothetical protein
MNKTNEIKLIDLTLSAEMKEHIKFINSVKEKLNKLSCIPIKYLGK